VNWQLNVWVDEAIRGYIGLAIMTALLAIGAIPTLWRIGRKSRRSLLGLLALWILAGISAANGLVGVLALLSGLLIVALLYFAISAWLCERTIASLIGWLALLGSVVIFVIRAVLFSFFGTMSGAL
jgi:hypothetical protein